MPPLHPSIPRRVEEAAYLTAPNAERYRVIVHHFYQQYVEQRDWLTAEEVWRHVRELLDSAYTVVEEVAGAHGASGLAERVFGDAHGLDSDRAAGRLLERMLVHRHARAGFALPLSAEDRETLFALSGLAIDEISSTVHVAGLGGTDPLLVAARAGRHVLALPLRTVYAVRDDAHAHGGVVFAVENRSVFAALHRAVDDLTGDRYPTLVCTGGHLSLAALRLLDALAAAGAMVRYSGDFDGKGLMIADALAGRLGSAFVPWRMDPDTYLRTIEARPAARRIDPGLFAPDVERRFGELVDLVRDRGAAFQEGWIDGLVEDVRAGAPDGDPDDPRS